MLSLPTLYSAQSQAKNIVSDWLLSLAYKDAVGGNGTLYFSGSDRTVSNFYHGSVIDWGGLQQSIDITRSQSSTPDIQITIANSWANESGLLSAELFGGNKKFINQITQIRSWIAGCNTEADCLRMHVGRLVDIQHTQSTVTITIETRSPWDRVKIGTVKTARGNYFPSVYGDYTPESSSAATPLFIDEAVVFPTKIDVVLNDAIYCLLHRYDAGTYNLHYYEKDLEQYCPFDPVNNAAGIYQGGAAITTAKSLRRSAKFHPPSVNAANEFLDVTYPATNAIDGNDATYAKEAQVVSGTGIGTYDGTVTEDLILDMPHIDGKLTALKVRVKWYIDALISSSGSYTTSPSGGVDLYEYSYDSLQAIGSISVTSISTSDSDSGDDIIDITAKYASADTLPDKIKLRYKTTFTATSDDAGSAAGIGTNCKIYEVDIIYDVAMDDSGEPQAVAEKISNMERLYCGIDGYDQDFTGGSGTAIYPHDIYRDMLDRYAGWDAGALDYVLVNGSVWSTTGTAGISIDSDRDWPCRWWTLEQVALKDVLEQLQFEGGFIWLIDGATTAVAARVVYVKSSYSSADHAYDGDDLMNIHISTTPFSEIVTTRKFNYQRHPADESRYLAQNEKVNTNIADYNLDALENIVEQDLDFLTATGDVDELLTYYDNIVGEPKMIVKCDLLNPQDWTTQVGDTATFTNMVYNPYGKDWTTPIYFMCVDTVISPNKFTATFREVG